MSPELESLLREVGTLAEKHTKNGWRFTRAGRRNPITQWVQHAGGSWQMDVDGEIASGPLFDLHLWTDEPHDPVINAWTVNDADFNAMTDEITAARIAVAVLRSLEG